MLADRWGTTDDDLVRSYPCDAFVANPTLQAWRAVTVEADPERIWPWLVQVRLAPYSYDWIDNLGRRSPRELRDLPDPQPGDPFTASAGRPLGRVLAVEHQVHLTARIMGATMTYLLVPVGPARTRLVLKIVAELPRPLAPALSLGDLVMARRQLLNFKRLAESG
ncbi:hypothetical protein ACOACQ_14595 [Nocardioides sp. CPCC 206347]|uniref:hypothetical protein n=1 Tax=unclassified Nocardioides TaxID=2615069 RepID=UPI00360DDD2F